MRPALSCIADFPATTPTPALTPEQIEQRRWMADEGLGLRHIARVMEYSPATVTKALVSQPNPESAAHPLGG